MADDNFWLESVLRRWAYEESPMRVLEVESAAAVGKNENYLSQMSKMKVKVLLGSGKTKNMTVMIKNSLTGDMGQFATQLGVFVREITMYRDILPKMEALMDECGDTDEPMWASCYDFRLYDRLVLEDLTASGYKMAKRTEQLSLDACLLVVKNIATFHGLSHVLLMRSGIPLEIFGRNVWKNLSKEYEEYNINSNYTNLLKSIDTWGDDWKEVRQRFESAMSKLPERMLRAMEPVHDDFVVLNHGDCWTNNFLFRNAPDSETPISMKFVDFQLCFTGPASYDLETLLATSVRPETYKESWDLIIHTYCDALKSTMLKLNYEGPVPDVDAMKQLMRRTHIFYLFNVIAVIPVVLGESKDIPDVEEALQKDQEARMTGEERKSRSMHEDLNGPAKTVIQFALRDAVDNGLI